MATNRNKNPFDWMKTTQFIIFCLSCVIGVVMWYYSQQDKMEQNLANRYVSKYEQQLLIQRIDNLEDSIRNFKVEVGQRIQKMESTNEEIIDLITDIRLTLASMQRD
jgi:tetrahydromethanopterin S-methyltransferase subunit G